MGKYPYFPKVNSTWNKKQKFDSISVKEITTPDNPDSDYEKLYFKADGELYKLNSSGVESVVGGSSGGAGNNMIMAQDTNASNHTYSTTTTATTGDSYSASITNETIANTASASNSSASTFVYTPNGSFGLSIGTIAGTVNFQISTGSSSAYAKDITIYFKNSAGGTVSTYLLPSLASHNSNHTATFPSGDIALWNCRFKRHGTSGSYGVPNVSLINGTWSGTRIQNRQPIVMNSSSEDGASATGYYASIETTNPFVTTDFGSSTRIASVAIMPRTQNTETIFQIQTSDDGSTWVTNRTILASSLTSWIYNYVKLTPVLARYVRIYGYSGASKVISFDEIKVKVGISDNDFLLGHYHKDISTTDTSLTLAGDSE